MSNYILEYIDKIDTGQILVSKKIHKVYANLKPIILDDDEKYYYNAKRGNRVIRFIETFCKQSKAEWAGKPIKLMLFQKAKMQAIFGILNRETNLRRFTEVFDVRARKNGKSVENSAMALYLLLMDGEMGGEIYSAATVMKQSKRVWEEARNMVEQDEELSEEIKRTVFPSPEMRVHSTKSTFSPLPKNVETFDGLNASGVVIDEVHALARAIYDILKQSMSVRRQPLMSMITTSGFVREGLFDDTYKYATQVIEGTVLDETFLPLIYELDKEEEMFEEECWIKANPALDIIKSRDFLRANVNRMKYDLNFALTVKVKDFNLIGVEEKNWLSYDVLNNEAFVDTKKFENKYAIGGLDLSRTGDLTSANTMFYDSETDKFIFETMYWIPEAKYEKVKDGKIPYKQWVDRGLIRLCEGNVIDYQQIAQYFYQEQAMDRGIVYLKIHYDAYSATYLIKEMNALGFSDRVMIRTQQGYKTLSIPMQLLGQMLEQKRVIYQNNPVTKWCLSNVELVQDRNGNYMPKKVDNKRERKIDGAATMINCFVGLSENYEEFVNA